MRSLVWLDQEVQTTLDVRPVCRPVNALVVQFAEPDRQVAR